MTAEQFFLIVMLVFVIALVVLKFIANKMEHNQILKQNVIDLKKQYDLAEARMELALSYEWTPELGEDYSPASQKRAVDDYRYWQRVFRQHRDAASKAGIHIPGIC
jgi:hypothetical protein